MPGAGPLGIGLRGTAPAGLEHASGAAPCPTGARGGGLGLPLAREGQPPSATAPGNPTANAPGHALESPRQAVPTLPTIGRTRPAYAWRHGGHGPCPRRIHGGHGSAASRGSVSQQNAGPGALHAAGGRRASEEAPPRGGGTRGGVRRLVGRRRGPRARQAPDRRQSGGSQPTESSRINRRVLLAPTLPMHRGKKPMKT
jgi:hypothetical protein